MSTLAIIEQATKHYADNRELLRLRVEDLHTEIEALKRTYMPSIKEAAANTANAKSSLESIIDGNKGLFVKPRSIIISGIKVGFQKGKGGLEYADEQRVIQLIRKWLPEDQHELLIKTTETVVKKALGELEVGVLKKIGVTVKDTGDMVLIKPVDSDVDKIINAMLKEANGESEEMEAA